MFGLFKKKNNNELMSLTPQTEREFRQQANQRIQELEMRFETLCSHLEVKVYKPYGYVVDKKGGIGAMVSTGPYNAGSVPMGAPMGSQTAAKKAG